MIKEFFDSLSAFPQPIPIIIIGIICLYFIYSGIRGIITRKFTVPFIPILFIGLLMELLYPSDGRALPILIFSVMFLALIMMIYARFKIKS
jgi:hypothetical protein